VRTASVGVAAIAAAASRHRTVARSVAASSVIAASPVGSADPNRRLVAGVADTVAVGVASADTFGYPKRYPVVGSVRIAGVASAAPIAHSAAPFPAAEQRHSALWVLLVGVVQQAGVLPAQEAVSLAVVRRFSPAAALASS
jgi:hypothetical protein